MKVVFSAPEPTIVHMAREYLASHNIQAVVQNERIASLAGSIPWTDTWLSLWVGDENEAAAKQLLENFGQQGAEAAREAANNEPEDAAETTEDGESSTWTCPDCGEKLGKQFTECWRCAQSSRESTGDAARQNRVVRFLLVVALLICGLVFLIVATHRATTPPKSAPPPQRRL